MGWISSLFQDGCDYSRLTGDIVHNIAVQPDAPWLEAGFNAYREPHQNTITGDWEIVYNGACLEYPSEHVDIDVNWKMAKGFAFLALVLGGGGTFFLWLNACCVFSRGTWRWAGYEILFASLFQTLSFLWFNTPMCTENKCSLSWGSKTDIMAAVFWFVAALCLLCYYPEPKNEPGDGLILDVEDSNFARAYPSPPRTEGASWTGRSDDGLPILERLGQKPDDDFLVGNGVVEVMQPGEDSQQAAKNTDSEII
jgi:hypothetical protein